MHNYDSNRNDKIWELNNENIRENVNIVRVELFLSSAIRLQSVQFSIDPGSYAHLNNPTARWSSNSENTIISVISLLH